MIALALRFWRPLAALALAVVLWAAYTWWADVQQGIGATTERAIWSVAIEKQKAEARRDLDAANARVDAAETTAMAARENQDLKDAQNAKITSELGRKLLVAGRLRDPAGARCGAGSSTQGAASVGSPGSSANDPAQDPGLLSASLSGLLRTLTREADAVNLAYIASRADADQLRGLLAAACGTPKP